MGSRHASMSMNCVTTENLQTPTQDKAMAIRFKKCILSMTKLFLCVNLKLPFLIFSTFFSALNHKHISPY